jgi:hypothetical protein
VRFAKQLMNKLQSLLRRRSEPQDPYSYVAARLKCGPGGRSTAVALGEPEPRRLLNVFGRRMND